MPNPGEVWKAIVLGGDGRQKERYVLVLSKPIANSRNVFLLTFSSKLHNARPDDVILKEPAELLQAGLSCESFISTNFVFTMQASDLIGPCGSILKPTLENVLARFLSHLS